MSVAESIVIFAPMFQLGCASACSTLAVAICALDHVRKGPPEQVRMILARSCLR